MSDDRQLEVRQVRVGDVERRHALDVLDAALGAGVLEFDEFARRSHECYLAATRGDLHQLLHDLPAPAELLAAAGGLESKTVRVAFGTIRRQGNWECPGRLEFSLRYSNAVIDFSQARLQRAETILDLDLIGSRLRLVVPRGSMVVTDDVDVTAGRLVNSVGRARGTGRLFTLTGQLRASTLSVRHRPLFT